MHPPIGPDVRRAVCGGGQNHPANHFASEVQQLIFLIILLRNLLKFGVRAAGAQPWMVSRMAWFFDARSAEACSVNAGETGKLHSDRRLRE